MSFRAPHPALDEIAPEGVVVGQCPCGRVGSLLRWGGAASGKHAVPAEGATQGVADNLGRRATPPPPHPTPATNTFFSTLSLPLSPLAQEDELLRCMQIFLADSDDEDEEEIERNKDAAAQVGLRTNRLTHTCLAAISQLS